MKVLLDTKGGEMYIEANKMLILDLDGTLLDDDKMISCDMVDMCREFIRNDFYVMIATGRAPTDTIQYYRKLGLNTIMINYNGGLVWDVNLLKKYHSIYLTDTSRIFDYLNSNYSKMEIQNILACADEQCFFLNHQNDYLVGLMSSPELESQFVGNEIYKLKNCQRIIVSLYDESMIPNWILRLRYLFRDIDIYQWSNSKNIIDISISRRHVSKWKAIKNFLDPSKAYYIIAIGDAQNDIEILQNATVGIAISNAEADVKQAADYVTEYDNNNDGIRKFLECNCSIWKDTLLK